MVKETKSASRRCLCETLRVTLVWCRVFGLAPIIWSHPHGRYFNGEHGGCVFAVSQRWLLYSAVLAIAYNVFLWHIFATDITNYERLILVANDGSYFICSAFLTLFAAIRTRHLVDSLNKCAVFLRQGLMCAVAKRCVFKFSVIGVVTFVVQLVGQIALVLVLIWNDHISEGIESIEIQRLMTRLVHNVPFIFYYLFCTVSTVYATIFRCFDTAMAATLPRDVADADVTTGVVCSATHCDAVQIVGKRQLLNDLDGLRILHESIRRAMVTANAALNPQIAVHLFIELAIIVIHLYSIIAHESVAAVNRPVALSNLLQDVLFVAIHLAGLVVFLLQAQSVKMAAQRGPMQHLIACSTKQLTPDEHASLRIFILKLVFMPAQFSAGHLFVLDISLVAPITGSVVTYLLVALQFRADKFLQFSLATANASGTAANELTTATATAMATTMAMAVERPVDGTAI